jgi:TIR domain
MTKPARVFISYSRRDGDWAQAFAQSLEKFGLEVWIDRLNVVPGQPWPARFEKALRESDVIAVVVNPAEALGPNLFFEVGAAVGMGKRLVPIFPKEYELSELPYPLRVRQGILRETPDETAKKLVAATRSE